MLKENDAVRKLLNADAWHAAGYTGKGVNILMLDLNGKLLDHMKEYCVLVDPESKVINEAKHNTFTAQVGHEFGPGAKVYVAPWSHSKKEIIQWLRDNPNLIDIANVSMSTAKSDDYEILKELGIITFCAVGNDYERGGDGVSFPASLDWTIGVGAYNWKDKGIDSHDVWGYSNWGKAVNCVGPSNITVLNENGSKREYTGTSTSSPVDAFIFACYLQWYKEQGLTKMTHAEAIAWVESHCIDLVDGEGQKVGEDDPSGKGLFCLPETLPVIEKGDDTMQIRPCPITMADYHHTAGNEKNAEQIRQEHMGPPNYWGDIGYNLVVLPSGEIEWGRDIKYSGAHDPGPAPDGSGYTMNQRAFAIACIGNFDEKEMAEAQYQGLLKAAVWTHNRFGLGVGDHHRHRDQYATKCPGDKFPWERLMADLKKEIEGVEEEMPLENVVVYFTAKDQSSADLYADEFKCLMTCRNGAATTLPEAMAAKRLFNIGGPRLGHPNEVYLAGEKAKHTAKLAADWLVANTK